MEKESATDAGSDNPPADRILGAHNVRPNPFNSFAIIEYYLHREAEVTVTIYNPNGYRMKKTTIQQQAPGLHAYRWDGRDHAGNPVALGVYFYRIQAGQSSVTSKIILLK